MFGAIFAWHAERVSRELERMNMKMKAGRRRPRKMMHHKDKQVEAFLNAISQDCYIESTKEADPANVEFIIDGVVNVRAALDAAFAVERDGSATGTIGAGE